MWIKHYFINRDGYEAIITLKLTSFSTISPDLSLNSNEGMS